MSESKKPGSDTEVLGPRDMPTSSEGRPSQGPEAPEPRALPTAVEGPSNRGADWMPSRPSQAPVITANRGTEVMPSRPSQMPSSASNPQSGNVVARITGPLSSTRPSQAPPPPADVVPGQVLDGKYLLERLLGAGGMGSVFAGTQITLARRVAVKTMHRQIAASSLYARRFQREAHAVARLEHPNVVRIFDSGQDAETGTLYLVMEYLDGESLGAYIKRNPSPPSLADVQDILLQVLDAFEVAHRAGIVHRDLKPDNIFLSLDHAGRRVVKIVDFGIAHVEDAPDDSATLTKEGMVAGTPSYMSPEQCRSLSVGPSSDLYAVGCVLTALLQRKPPFYGKPMMDIMTHQLYMPPPPLARPDGAEPVPALLERLRLELLAKSPADRPESAAAVRARLVEAFSSEAARERLPPRKSDVPLGAREERAPKWTSAGGIHVESTLESAEKHVVGLVRLSGGQGGVGETCVTGLAVLNIHIRELRRDEPPTPVVVFDIGHDIEAGRASLAELARVSPAAKGVITMADVTIEGMNALIEAGAARVLPYPVRPDALAKVLERLLRRKR